MDIVVVLEGKQLALTEVPEQQVSLLRLGERARRAVKHWLRTLGPQFRPLRL